MLDNLRIHPRFPVNQRAENILLGINSTRITVEPDGTARAMTIEEQEDWLDLQENVDRLAASNGRERGAFGSNCMRG